MTIISPENFEGLDKVILDLEKSTGTTHTDVENTYQAKFEQYFSLLRKQNEFAYNVFFNKTVMNQKTIFIISSFSVNEEGLPISLETKPVLENNRELKFIIKYGKSKDNQDMISILRHEYNSELKINTTSMTTYQDNINTWKKRELVGHVDTSKSINEIIHNNTTLSTENSNGEKEDFTKNEEIKKAIETQRSLEIDETSKSKNLLLNQNDIKYFYLPINNADNSHIRVMKKDEKLFINLKLNDSEETTTCQILEAGYVSAEENNLQLKLSYGQAHHIVTLPINCTENKEMLDDLNNLVNNAEIETTTIENNNSDVAGVENFTPSEIEDVQPEMSIEGNAELKSRIKKSQELQEETFNFQGKDIKGLSQEFITQVLTISDGKENRHNLKRDQRFTILDSQEVLAIVSKGDVNTPTAVFTKDKDDKVFLNISTEYLNQFKKENPLVSFENGEITETFTTFNIKNLKLDLNIGNLTIESKDIQMKGANTDFAILFSALGCKVQDKYSNKGTLKNADDMPFDISVSNEFVQNAFNESNGCIIDNSEPGYSALLISMIQQERHKQGNENQNKVVELNLNGTQLYSVPFKDADGNMQYLNLRKEKDKIFAYMHISTEDKPNSLTVPKFWEIRETGLERNETGDVNSLYFGLIGSNKNVTSVNFKLPNFEENKDSLIYLKKLLTNEFEQMNLNQSSSKGTLKELNLDETKFDIHPIPNEATTRLESLDRIARLTRTITPDTEAVTPVATISDPEIELLQHQDNFNEDNPENEEPDPKKKDENEKSPEELLKDAQKDKAKSTSLLERIGDWEGPKDLKGEVIENNIFVGLFILAAVLSVIVPIFIPISFALGCFSVVNATKPWKVAKTINDYKKQKATSKEAKEALYEKLNIQTKTKQLKLKEKQTKLNNSISNKNKQISYLLDKRNFVLNNPKLSYDKKQKLLNKIDKTINKARIKIAKNQTYIETSKKDSEYFDNSKPLAVVEEIKKYQKKDDKKLTKIEEKSLNKIKNEKENFEKIDELLLRKDNLSKEEQKTLKKLLKKHLSLKLDISNVDNKEFSDKLSKTITESLERLTTLYTNTLSSNEKAQRNRKTIMENNQSLLDELYNKQSSINKDKNDIWKKYLEKIELNSINPKETQLEDWVMSNESRKNSLEQVNKSLEQQDNQKLLKKEAKKNTKNGKDK